MSRTWHFVTNKFQVSEWFIFRTLIEQVVKWKSSAGIIEFQL